MNVLPQRTPEDPTLVQGLIDRTQLLADYAASRVGDMLGLIPDRIQKPLAVFAGAASIGGALAGAEAMAAPQPPSFFDNLPHFRDPAAIKAHKALVRRCEEKSKFVTSVVVSGTTPRGRNRFGSAEMTAMVTGSDGDVRAAALPVSLKAGESFRTKLTWKYRKPTDTTWCGMEVTTHGGKVYFPKPDRKTSKGGEFVDAALAGIKGQPVDPNANDAQNMVVYFRPKKE